MIKFKIYLTYLKKFSIENIAIYLYIIYNSLYIYFLYTNKFSLKLDFLR